MNRYDRGYMWTQGIERGRRGRGCYGCLPIIAAAAAIVIGIFIYRIDGAANMATAAKEIPVEAVSVESNEQDEKSICSLSAIVCDGEAYASAAQEAWIDKLERCESSGNPKAINPKDLDGTPSYGSFQFKPSTFDMYSKRYGIEGEMMDRSAQREIVIRMLSDKTVRWQNEFPDCVRKLGVPPKK